MVQHILEKKRQSLCVSKRSMETVQTVIKKNWVLFLLIFCKTVVLVYIQVLVVPIISSTYCMHKYDITCLHWCGIYVRVNTEKKACDPDNTSRSSCVTVSKTLSKTRCLPVQRWPKASGMRFPFQALLHSLSPCICSHPLQQCRSLAPEN